MTCVYGRERSFIGIAFALLMASSPVPTFTWNIGGHSPVTDHSDKDLVAAATYAMGQAEKLGLPLQGDGDSFSLGDEKCGCRGCGCIVSATKQVVAGINWDIVFRIVPKDENAPDQYRKVTIFDESFKGNSEDNKYSVSKSVPLDEKAAKRKQFTQAAVDSMTNPNAESHATSKLRASAGSDSTDSLSNPNEASKYMNRLSTRMGNLVTTVLEQGDCSSKVKTGDKVSMHYTGTLAKDGSKFDSSYDRNQPFEFIVGAGQVIKGWEQAVPGMCVGEKAKLYIPSDLAYGDRGFGTIIAPKSNLYFTVELVSITKQ